ncbi:MAG TPA: bifunctional 5,10-methylenetetrahydrofolate dehydrogenase/5,10-methenyltetrahydrofolate cyclohydrolase [Candidatus Saccharibacteria bacterium]|jgi:methylenetetrahydrofolate dehydrogenase (NADP+)/methenyltetrahydrofolate cyclohydrolase|nr:bifunctional 5,10-methylenetetrahydrofolate dehydrogenase/5,10-methenyltetrahydrofolate cyclohydrolase [Candidatus Saccharibacteria bacterium]
MRKELNGAELAGFIKERQAKAVRGLRQQWQIAPKLAIIRTNPDPVVDSYMRIKQAYGDDILVDVDVHTIEQPEVIELIKKLNDDPSVHGIIVQIPLPDPSQTDEVLNRVTPEKDVDGLAVDTCFDAPTPVAINWLLTGYDVEYAGKHIVIVGHGRLVGAPLQKLWQASGLEVTVVDKHTENLALITKEADILVTATGVPALITAEMVKSDAIIVDAGVATDSNGLVGDVATDVREMPGISITPIKGGVGPLTVAALFENVITAARNSQAR